MAAGASQQAQERLLTAFTANKLVERLLLGGLEGFESFSARTAELFVSGVGQAPDKREMLFRLDALGERDEKKMSTLLRRVLSEDDSPRFLSSVTISFLKWLGSDDLNRGTCRRPRDKIVEVIGETPGLFATLVESVKSGAIHDVESLHAVAWYFEVYTLAKERLEDKRAFSHLRAMAVLLQTPDRPVALREVAKRMLAILEPRTAMQAASIPANETPTAIAVPPSLLEVAARTPGGRHDNDWEDYRCIAIIPTVAEATCMALPFLPTPRDTWPMLDRHFRLLREDMILSLRTILLSVDPTRNAQSNAAQGGKKQKKLVKHKPRRVWVFEKAVLAGFDHNTFHEWSFRVEFALPSNHPALSVKKKAERKDFWDIGRGKKQLGRGTIAYIASKKTPHIPLLLGEITWRDSAALASDAPAIGLCFADAASTLAALRMWLEPPSDDLVLIPVQMALFSYEPVLKRLQAMPVVPFAAELDDQFNEGIRPVPATYADHFQNITKKYDGTGPLSTDALALDEGQRQAVAQALRQRVTLVQGPPGTGKTHVGICIAKLLLQTTVPFKILCVTYTNHALDDFLTGLVKSGITNVLRIGGRSANPSVAQYTLQTQLGGQGKGAPTAGFNRRWRSIKDSMDSIARQIDETQEKLAEFAGKHHNALWPDVSEFLESEGSPFAPFLTPCLKTRDDFTQVAQSGKAISADYLWKKWLAGKSKPPADLGVPTGPSCWDLPRAQRIELAKEWRETILKEKIKDLLRLRTRADEAVRDLQDLKREQAYSLVDTAQVILCTTTGAAKHWELLENARCDVLLVEEAGEILEPHVLAALYERCQSLIMIGDHKQLRPKVENYELRVESNKGYNLNISLFERLILRGYPCSVLTMQHRMHPAISHLIKGTYPTLLDSEKVASHPPLLGVANRVVFIDHQHAEGNDDDLLQDDGTSFVNNHEAEMAAQIVAYLLRQGYNEDQLVVLTPYLAQLRKLSTFIKAEISRADSRDLLKSGGDPLPVSTSTKSKGVRVATVDNYQGEESDVVIISLVRSNKQKNMGFVGDSNRVNVLMSRARNGLIILGNASFLCSVTNVAARQLWVSLLDRIKSRNQFYAAFPAVCQRHKQATSIVLPADFARNCPEGGCSQSCGISLACGHKCLRRCHVDDPQHVATRCTTVSSTECAVRHKYSWKCGDREPSECPTCARLHAQQLEEERERQQAAQKRAQVQAELDIQLAKVARDMAELQREHEHERLRLEKEAQLRRDELDAERRKQQLQIQKDLSNLAPQPVQSGVKSSAETEAEAKLSEASLRTLDESAKYQHHEKVLKNQTEEIKGLALLAQAATVGNINEFVRALESLSLEQQSAAIGRLAEIVGTVASEWFPTTLKPPAKEVVTSASQGIKMLAAESWLNGRKHFHTRASAKNLAGEQIAFAKLALLLCDMHISDPSKEMLPQCSLSATTMPAFLKPLEYFVRASLLSSLANEHRPEAAALAVAFLRCPTATSVLPQPFWRAKVASIFKAHGPALGEAILRRHFGSSPAPAGDLQRKPLTEDEVLRNEWEDRKTRHDFKSPAMDKVIGMAALANLKRQLLRIVDACFFDKKRGTDPRKGGFNLRFEGNPGTGKTTAAALYAEILADLGLFGASNVTAQPQPASSSPAAGAQPAVVAKTFVETSGAELSQGGASDLQKHLDSIEKAGGGVLFIDEAYMLDPSAIGGQGKQALNLLLAEMEKRRGSLIVVFAGYKDQMEKLFQYNDGLPSRFSATVTFDDYDDKQLFDIFCGLMRAQGGRQPLRFENDNPHWGHVAMRRLGASRNTRGFGNARSVRKLFEAVIARVAERWQKSPNVDMFVLTKSDLIGPSALDAAASSAAWKRLNEMIGLDKVKASVAALFEVVKTNEQMELEMRPRQDVVLNRIFLGNPGTGKTTVAHLYAEILRDFGLLSKGKVVSKAASDFVGAVLGESQSNTRAILKEAEGCVLLIDEAYGLAGKDPYKSSVIDTIVEQVQGVPGEDRCVVLLGYREQMEAMLRDSNPGLQRRFQLENAFQFDDYNDQQLLTILKQRIKQKGLEAGPDALQVAIDALSVLRATQPPFGNAGAVNNLLSEAITRKAGRGGGTSRTLESQDFKPPSTENDEDEASLFKGLIGCDQVIEVLREYRATFVRAQKLGQDPLKKVSLNFRFVGAPGTGKTTVAKRTGRMFKSLGVLPTADVVEMSGSDLVAQFVGQTAPKTRDAIDKALGKVLFVDEAYSLRNGLFGKEAIDELVRCLTFEKYMGHIVVILAGYEDDIAALMDSNEGLRSRFEQLIHFPSFNVDDGCKLMRMRLNDADVCLTLSADADASLAGHMQRLVNAPDFANGRDINNWVKRLERSIAVQSVDIEEASSVITDETLRITLEGLLKDRKPRQIATPQLEPALNPIASIQATPLEVQPKAASARRIVIQQKAATAKSEEEDAGGVNDDKHLEEAAKGVGGNFDDLPALLANPRFTANLAKRLGSDEAARRLTRRKEEERTAFERLKREYEEGERRKAEEAAQRQRELEERIRQEEEAARKAKAAAEKAAAEERARRLQEEREAALLAEQQRLDQQKRLQEALRRISPCPAGFNWYPVPGGYQCGGGSHFVSAAQLPRY